MPRPETTPDAGHGSGRLTLGARLDERQAAAELRWRPAYHDRLDPPGGYMAGGEIEFLDLGLLARDRGVTLADARLLSVQALAPRSDIGHPISWQVSTGVRRYGLEDLGADGRGALGEYVDGGPGLAWFLGERAQAYVFALSALDANHDLAKGYSLGAGARAGFAAQPRSWFSASLEGDWLGDVLGSAAPRRLLHAQGQLHLDVNDGLRLRLDYGRDAGRERTALRLLYERYF